MWWQWCHPRMNNGHLHVLWNSLAPSDCIAHLFWPISYLNVCCLKLFTWDIYWSRDIVVFYNGRMQDTIFWETKTQSCVTCTDKNNDLIGGWGESSIRFCWTIFMCMDIINGMCIMYALFHRHFFLPGHATRWSCRTSKIKVLKIWQVCCGKVIKEPIANSCDHEWIWGPEKRTFAWFG